MNLELSRNVHKKSRPGYSKVLRNNDWGELRQLKRLPKESARSRRWISSSLLQATELGRLEPPPATVHLFGTVVLGCHISVSTGYSPTVYDHKALIDPE
jgi:hypothetical protein